MIFASDNGPDPLVGNVSNGELRGTKYMINEGGIRVPLMVRWRGNFLPGTRVEAVHFVDVVPTLMEICRLEKGSETARRQALDGVSLAGLLSDSSFRPVTLPQRRFWQWNRGTPRYSHNAAVLEGSWKAVRPYSTRNIPKAASKEKGRLYDLSRDPGEAVDLSAEEPERLERMLKALKEWSAQVEKNGLLRPPIKAQGSVEGLRLQEVYHDDVKPLSPKKMTAAAKAMLDNVITSRQPMEF